MALDHRTTCAVDDALCRSVPWAISREKFTELSVAAMTTELPRACRCEAEDTSVLSELLELGQVGE
jgi:hypothetical protein